LFKEQLSRVIAEGADSQSELAVLFIDLDGFKSINDTLGHSIGDALLRSFASRLRDALSETDRLARLGGDEFAILQVGEDQPDRAMAHATKILELAATPFLVEGHQLTIGASIGIVTQRICESDPVDLLKNADLAMYRAKLDGRGTYRVYDLEMDSRAQARRALELSLRGALAHNELSLVYQPLVTLQTGTVCAFEALLRWKHPQRGNVSPAEFIPVAEEIGLIVQIGEWVLRQACAEAAKWPESVNVAVNLSPAQFAKGSLVSTVINALSASGLSPGRLELEITESVLLERSERNIAILEQLHDLGVKISMDDFGTGYSSLSYLHRFPFDKIKIDKSFIDEIAFKPSSVAIVRAIIEMAKALGMSTTAEGVETADQLEQLNLLGCSDIQGYLFSKPEASEFVSKLLMRRMAVRGR
jgi:diguanylate cyclase (GGDEF)-like protein